jgi:hypothetical protein
MIVWKSFQEARPNSALAVSLPSLGAMGLPWVRGLLACCCCCKAEGVRAAVIVEACGVCEELSRMKAQMMRKMAMRIGVRRGAAAVSIGCVPMVVATSGGGRQMRFVVLVFLVM